MDWENILKEALSKLVAWVLVSVAYHASYSGAERMRRKSGFWNSRLGMFLAYPCYLFCVAVIIFLFWPSYGTDKEQVEREVSLFIALGLPAIVAIYRHYKKRPVKGDAQ